MEEIIAKLEAFIRELCEAEDDPEFGLDINLFDTGFLDSVGAMDVIVFAEETFHQPARPDAVSDEYRS